MGSDSFARPDLEKKGFFLVKEYDHARRDPIPYVGYRCRQCGGLHKESPSMSGRGHEPWCIWKNPPRVVRTDGRGAKQKNIWRKLSSEEQGSIANLVRATEAVHITLTRADGTGLLVEMPDA